MARPRPRRLQLSWSDLLLALLCGGAVFAWTFALWPRDVPAPAAAPTARVESSVALRAGATVLVAFRRGGTIAELRAVGESVKVGEPLGKQIHAVELEERIAELQERELHYQERLRRGTVHGADVRAKIREKRERVARLQALLDTWVVAAPARGRVAKHLAGAGHYVDGAAPVIELRELPRGEAVVSNANAESLQPGAIIEVSVRGTRLLRGHVDSSTPRDGATLIRFTLDEPATAEELREPRLISSSH